jgi:outer membrane protein
MNSAGKWTMTVAVMVVFLGTATQRLPAQTLGQETELTLDLMVELGLRDSYRVRQLQLDVERTRSLLRAEQAGLKSKVELQLATPDIQTISDYKWNSNLQLNELVAENTRRWQLDLSVRQPVILFGYPTNGVLSFNNRVYRYAQIDDGGTDVRYYNRYFIGYNQPLFQPNSMRNDLEEAELNLENSELRYQQDVLGTIQDLAEDYYDFLEDAYQRQIAANVVGNLERAADATDAVVRADPSRAIELDQMRVELANAREDLSQAGSSLRQREEDIKRRLLIPATQTLFVRPVLEVRPVRVEAERAIELARTLAPRMRQLEINLRKGEIQLDETKGRDSFRMNVGFTYGNEVQNPLISRLFSEPRNSYTLDVNATVPIWDWGQRQQRIKAQEFSVARTELSIEEALADIETDVRTQVRNLDDYESRLMAMQQNLELAQQTTNSMLGRYRTGDVAFVDVTQTLDREINTAENFLDAYMGYQRTLRRLTELTFYDFEYDMPVVERFTICLPDSTPCSAGAGGQD